MMPKEDRTSQQKAWTPREDKSGGSRSEQRSGGDSAGTKQTVRNTIEPPEFAPQEEDSSSKSS